MFVNTIGILIFVILCACLIVVLYTSNTKENYSIYKSYSNNFPGLCGYRTGKNYLDVYEQQDYYSKYPYMYPTPNTFTTKWYELRRQLKQMYAPKTEVVYYPNLTVWQTLKQNV